MTVQAGGQRRASGTPDYEAATGRLAFRDRSDRARVSLRGRASEQVLTGLVSGKVPPPPAVLSAGLRQGRAEGSALLTPKGRMVAVLRLLRAGPRGEDGFLMDFAPACRNAALGHLRKFVPPRLATVHDESSATGMLTLLGPDAARKVAVLATDALDPARLAALGEGDALYATSESGDLTVVRTTEVAAPAFDVIAPAQRIASLRDALAAEGVPAVGEPTWEVLRVEAGWPEYGVDMDDQTIPVEADIHTRVVDYQKGCFTGQEVLIRIRDRGHVNRLLRGLHFGDAAPPEPGSELFLAGEERTVGRVTSAVRSPRFGEAIGLGYVRREVSPPGELRVGSPSGAAVTVASLSERWSPAEGST